MQPSASNRDPQRLGLLAAISDFRQSLQGQLLGPDHHDYDSARRVWNAMVDKHPALIARCTTTDDVIKSVRFAREHDLLVSVRGGGHNYAGIAVCEGGLMIDLSLMKNIELSPAKRTARAQPGVRLGEFDAATQKYGLATTLGINTDTGIAGLTLGGGYGWLNGRFGLACDNLIAAEVVTADGIVLRASADQNPDVFWALRGAGPNFGIVTSFEYSLHEVGPVLGGLVLHQASAAIEVLRVHHEFSSSAPDEVSTTGVLLCAPDGTPMVGTAVCYSGKSLAEGEKLLEPLRTFGSPVADLVVARPYCDMQTLFDEAWVPGRHYYNKSHIIRSLSGAAIETLIEYARSMPTPLTAIALQQAHGAAARVGLTETAFPHRYDHYSLYIHPASEDAADRDGMVRWARDCWEAMKEHVEPAVYVNALEDAYEEGEARVRAAFGLNYDRLTRLKARYDPDNFFRQNANIKPTTSASAPKR